MTSNLPRSGNFMQSVRERDATQATIRTLVRFVWLLLLICSPAIVRGLYRWAW